MPSGNHEQSRVLRTGWEEVLQGHVNASYGGDEGDRHSSTRCVATIMEAAVLWLSHIKKHMILS